MWRDRCQDRIVDGGQGWAYQSARQQQEFETGITGGLKARLAWMGPAVTQKNVPGTAAAGQWVQTSCLSRNSSSWGRFSRQPLSTVKSQGMRVAYPGTRFDGHKRMGAWEAIAAKFIDRAINERSRSQRPRVYDLWVGPARQASYEAVSTSGGAMLRGRIDARDLLSPNLQFEHEVKDSTGGISQDQEVASRPFAQKRHCPRWLIAILQELPDLPGDKPLSCTPRVMYQLFPAVKLNRLILLGGQAQPGLECCRPLGYSYRSLLVPTLRIKVP
jgi:hypothetical protein